MEFEFQKLNIGLLREVAKKLDLRTFCRLYQANRTMLKTCEYAESAVTIHATAAVFLDNRIRFYLDVYGDITSKIEQSKFKLQVKSLLFAVLPVEVLPVPQNDDEMRFAMNYFNGRKGRIEHLMGVNCNANLLTDFIQKFRVTKLTNSEVVADKKLEDVLLSRVEVLHAKLSGVDPNSFLLRGLDLCKINFVNNPIKTRTIRKLIEMLASDQLKLTRWNISPLAEDVMFDDDLFEGFWWAPRKDVFLHHERPLIVEYEDNTHDFEFDVMSASNDLYAFIVDGNELTIEFSPRD